MKDINRILEILGGWRENYPSLVLSLLWRIEFLYIDNDDLKGSNIIMRFRADAYKRIAEKYKAIDPDAIYLFEHESMYASSAVRQMLSQKQLARQEESRQKHIESIKELCEKDPVMDKSFQVESYDSEAYSHIEEYITDELPGLKSLFDAKFTGSNFNKSEDRSILDILEALSYDEEKRALQAEETSFYKIDDRYRTGYHEDALKFRGITGYDGKQHLCPFRTVYGLFFRGQSEYYENCLSSIDRNLKPEQLFVERLKSVALERLFSNNPSVNPFIVGQVYSLPNGKDVSLSCNIDYSALAQHYGVKTNLLDITTDKMIAAFFACTGHNNKEDKYYAYNKNGYGVFYVYRDKNIFSKDSRVSCVGLQPLSRPGAQAGYVLAMNSKEDFNVTCSEAISFKHDKVVAKQIFEIVNFLGKPFVEDVMSQKAKELVRSRTFSNFDRELTIAKYYPMENTSTIERWINESGINFIDDEVITFSDKDKECVAKESEDVRMQLQTRVYYRTTFQMEIKDE